MMNTPWLDFLAARGAVPADGRVQHFGQPQAELAATGNGDIIADLSHLGLLQVEGEDALTFLQGQVTNDIKLLDGSNSQYAGYCTPKGRLLAIFLAFAHRDHFHLQLNGALTEQTMKRLKMYVLRSKVTIADVTDSIIRFGVAGANTTAALQQIFPGIPQHPHQLVNLETANIIRLPGATPRYEIFASPEHAAEIWMQLQQSCTPVGTSCWEWLEILAGIPDIAPATIEAFVPQMVNLDLIGGISFKKGCYTGQEIVARTHYLGKVKRRTHLAHIAPPAAPQPGDALYGTDTAEAVGKIVNVAPAPMGGHDVLAEIRLDSVAAGAIRWKSPDGVALTFKALPYQME
ncbi:MAG: glycine cleavage system protein T [Methylophilales bacterium RIFCSPHIGHO2_02_FULL_57_10]|nr:MAG: glycine cleavage system protein T [Methylophilales bacterium RIFCSPHIGHO2_02_FULL_57_10]